MSPPYRRRPYPCTIWTQPSKGPKHLMHTPTKTHPAARETTITAIRPIMLHEVSNQVASNVAASRRRIRASQPASGEANHSRHHVSRKTQS